MPAIIFPVHFPDQPTQRHGPAAVPARHVDLTDRTVLVLGSLCRRGGRRQKPHPDRFHAFADLGKQLGIFTAIYLAVRLKICPKPAANWSQIYGMAVLCGIGFTMSLFIGDLAFSDPDSLNIVKQAVLAGSAVSAIFGYAVLAWAGNLKHERRDDPDLTQAS